MRPSPSSHATTRCAVAETIRWPTRKGKGGDSVLSALAVPRERAETVRPLRSPDRPIARSVIAFQPLARTPSRGASGGGVWFFPFLIHPPPFASSLYVYCSGYSALHSIPPVIGLILPNADYVLSNSCTGYSCIRADLSVGWDRVISPSSLDCPPPKGAHCVSSPHTRTSTPDIITAYLARFTHGLRSAVSAIAHRSPGDRESDEVEERRPTTGAYTCQSGPTLSHHRTHKSTTLPAHSLTYAYE